VARRERYSGGQMGANGAERRVINAGRFMEIQLRNKVGKDGKASAWSCLRRSLSLKARCTARRHAPTKSPVFTQINMHATIAPLNLIKGCTERRGSNAFM
jgi:hypothetical protein